MMTGEVLTDDPKLTLDDLCETCGVSEVTIRAYVAEGVIEVNGDDAGRWRFSEISLVRVQKAYRLQRDLRLNAAGAALALELMSQIEALNDQLERLKRLRE